MLTDEGARNRGVGRADARDTRDHVPAHKFINFFLRPEIAAANANAIQYASTNREAEPLVDDALKNDPRIYPPPALRSKLQLVPLLDRDRDALVNRHWYNVRRKFMAEREVESSEPTATLAK